MNALLHTREQRGITRRWLSKELGISKTTLWRYEKGYAKPPVSLLFMAAHLLHVSIEDLIYEDAR